MSGLKCSLAWRVMAVEGRRIRRSPVLWMGSVVLPLFALLFMTTVFGSGTMDRLPVGVVDHDATPLSRQLVRQVDASPSLRVAGRYADEAEARAALQRMEVYGYLILPPQLQRDAFSGRHPVVTASYHYALLGVGSRVATAFRVALSGSRLPPAGLSLPQGNVNLNYVVYLAYPFFMVMWQALCLLVTVYALRRFGRRRWAVRLVPYGAILAAVGVLAHALCFGGMGIPLAGPVAGLWLWSVAFLTVTQALGVAIARWSGSFSTAMSVASMVGSLGATLSGVTFPLFAMARPVQWVAWLFPVRWWMEGVQWFQF